MVISESKIIISVRQVFSRPGYMLLSLAITFGAISLIALLPNRSLLVDFLGAADVTIGQKLNFLFQLYVNLDSHMHAISVVGTLVIAILLGINVALLTYYIKHRRISGRNKFGHAAGFLGLVAGIFGIGCAACGSLIIIGLLSTIGAAGVLALLPFAGAEFSLLGIVLLILSIRALGKRIADPLICPT